MAFDLPTLPYADTALEPTISAETISYHYGKHHAAYVANLNKLAAGTQWEGMSLDEIVRNADGGVFNNAAQIWNHTFYWNCLSPEGGGLPSGALAELINETYGDFATFQGQFSTAAATLFGSGWTWLVKDAGGKLAITTTGNAGNPMTEGLTPLLTCDVWEHAYYVDYRNARPAYVKAFWNLVNWDFVAANL